MHIKHSALEWISDDKSLKTENIDQTVEILNKLKEEAGWIERKNSLSRLSSWVQFSLLIFHNAIYNVHSSTIRTYDKPEPETA